jgi:hypothetical protein
MRIGLSVVVMLGLGSAAAAQTQPAPQPRPQLVISGDQRYCLIEHATGIVSCNFATMDQCQQTQATGGVGDCESNPRLTTGVRSRE